MIRHIFSFLHATEEVHLDFSISASEAEKRLRQRVNSCIGLKEALVGNVSNKVWLMRGVPFFQNSFRPILVGKFTNNMKGCAFIGEFRLHRLVQMSISVWVAFAILWSIVAIIIVLAQGQFEKIPFAFGGLGMAFVGEIFVRFGMFLSRYDKKWILRKVEEAITENIDSEKDQPEKSINDSLSLEHRQQSIPESPKGDSQSDNTGS